MIALLALVARLAACSWPAPLPREAQRPDVLVVVWDTVRADRTSLDGGPARTTPWLARFAREGRVYTAAVSPGIWTLPAHASLFTGLEVADHGANWAAPWLEDGFVTFAEWFAAHGYATFAWSSNPNVHPFRNTAQGFGTYRSPFGRADDPWRKAVLEETRARMDPRDRSSRASPRWPGRRRTLALNVAGATARRALLRWLEEERPPDRPWLAFVNLMEAHDPRLPSLPARRAALGSPRRVVASLLTDLTPARMHRATWGDTRWPEEDREVLAGVVDATLMDLDRATELLVDALARRGHLDDAVVVVTSDHGEMLGEHGVFRHNRGVWQGLVHVPLVIRGGGVRPGHVDRPVSTAGVFAALCALAHLGCPDDPRLDRSVARALGPGSERPPGAPGGPAAWGARPGPEPVLAVVRDPVGDRSPDDPPWLWRAETAIFDGRWKLVLASDGTVRLHDLTADPGEATDLAPRRPEVVRRLRTWLRGHLADHPWHHPRVPPHVELDADGLYRADPAMAEALRALGYVE